MENTVTSQRLVKNKITDTTVTTTSSPVVKFALAVVTVN
jgi:hypothetical protein